MGHDSTIHAVLMGDIVHSEHNAATEHLYACFNAAIERQNQQHAMTLASPLTITLGDEFQGLVNTLAVAAQMARDIRLDLLDNAIDCRFALGVATLKTPLNPARAWNMMGPGLALTRERLNEKSASNLYRFAIPDFPILETMLEASGAGLTAIERRWTDTQRRDIRALLQGASPDDVARRRNVSVHSIYKVRASGDFELYQIHLNAIGAALRDLDKIYAMRRGEA